MVKAQKPSPQTVFNLLADNLVEQFGSGIPDENEDDWGPSTSFASWRRAGAGGPGQRRPKSASGGATRMRRTTACPTTKAFYTVAMTAACTNATSPVPTRRLARTLTTTT